MNTAPFQDKRFIDLVKFARPRHINAMLRNLEFVRCPCCGGDGIHAEPTGEELFGLPVLEVRVCGLCAPYGAGVVPAWCPS